jgi:hypothetical protein
MGEASSTPRGVQLLIVGHSHSWCYGGHSGRSLDDYEMGPIDEARGLMRIGIGSDSVKPGYWDAAVDLAKTYRVAVCWQGNQHAGSFMFLEKPFDFALASHPGLVVDKGVDLVPELQVREMFQPSMAPLEMVLRRMLDTGGPRTTQPSGAACRFMPIFSPSWPRTSAWIMRRRSSRPHVSA